MLDISHAGRVCEEVCYQERLLRQVCALKEGVPCLQVSRMEFVLLWATFVAIMLTDLERGIGIGIVMAVLYFAYSYAQASPLTVTPAGLDAQLNLFSLLLTIIWACITQENVMLATLVGTV